MIYITTLGVPLDFNVIALLGKAKYNIDISKQKKGASLDSSQLPPRREEREYSISKSYQDFTEAPKIIKPFPEPP